MRSKYRSSIYVFEGEQMEASTKAMRILQVEFENPIITTVESFGEFRLNQKTYLDYYYKNPQKPFCKNIVSPKLRLLLKRFSAVVDPDKLAKGSLDGR